MALIYAAQGAGLLSLAWVDGVPLVPDKLLAGRFFVQVVLVVSTDVSRVILELIDVLLDFGDIPVQKFDLTHCDGQVPPVDAVLLNQVLVELLLDL